MEPHGLWSPVRGYAYGRYHALHCPAEREEGFVEYGLDVILPCAGPADPRTTPSGVALHGSIVTPREFFYPNEMEVITEGGARGGTWPLFSVLSGFLDASLTDSVADEFVRRAVFEGQPMVPHVSWVRAALALLRQLEQMARTKQAATDYIRESKLWHPAYRTYSLGITRSVLGEEAFWARAVSPENEVALLPYGALGFVFLHDYMCAKCAENKQAALRYVYADPPSHLKTVLRDRVREAVWASVGGRGEAII